MRRLRVLSMDEAATADQEAVASEALEALAEELQVSHGIVIPSIETVDDMLFLPLAYLLAYEIAPDFSVAAPEPRSRALIRLRSVTNPTDLQSTVKAVYY